MYLYEAIAVMLVGTVMVLFVTRREKSRGRRKKIAKMSMSEWLAATSPLVVAAVVIAGLLIISVENLGGDATRQWLADPSASAPGLAFRH